MVVSGNGRGPATEGKKFPVVFVCLTEVSCVGGIRGEK